VGVVGNAGGPVKLAVDALEGSGLVISRQRLLAADAAPSDYESAVGGLLADDEVDSVLTSFVPPLRDQTAAVAHAVGRASATAPAKPVVANFLVAHPVAVPSYLYPEAAAMALARLVERAEWLACPQGEMREPEGMDVVGAHMLVDSLAADSWLSDDDAGRLLDCFGVPRSRRDGEGAEGVEVAVSVVQHESFGPVIRLGVGGGVAELVGDHAARILPLTDVDAAALVRAPKASALLFGWRGAKPAAVDALEDVLLRVSALIEDVPQVAELALNPILVTPEAATVVAARVRLAPYTPHPELSLRRLR
jgi:acyl-CoA synthetase (NDP forming)